MNRKLWLFFLLGALGICLAATTWPFLMATFYPNINHNDDIDSAFRYGSVLPRLVMGSSVSNIKRGDVVRITYPNGEIWDMETSATCSPYSSIPCPYNSNGTRVNSPTSPGTPSKYLISVEKQKESARCYAGGGTFGYIPIRTSYWTSWGYTDSSGVVQMFGKWVDTGTTLVAVYWPLPYPRMCP